MCFHIQSYLILIFLYFLNIGNFSGIDQFFEIAGFELGGLYCTFKKNYFLGFTQDEKHTVSTTRGKHTSKICL